MYDGAFHRRYEWKDDQQLFNYTPHCVANAIYLIETELLASSSTF